PWHWSSRISLVVREGRSVADVLDQDSYNSPSRVGGRAEVVRAIPAPAGPLRASGGTAGCGDRGGLCFFGRSRAVAATAPGKEYSPGQAVDSVRPMSRRFWTSGHGIRVSDSIDRTHVVICIRAACAHVGAAQDIDRAR